MATIAGNIKRLREEASLTQEELAARVKVKQTAISKWERVRTAPGVRSLMRLAIGLRTPVEQFLKDVDPEYDEMFTAQPVAASVQPAPAPDEQGSSISPDAAALRAAVDEVRELANEFRAATAATIAKPRRQASTARAVETRKSKDPRRRRG